MHISSECSFIGGKYIIDLNLKKAKTAPFAFIEPNRIGWDFKFYFKGEKWYLEIPDAGTKPTGVYEGEVFYVQL